MCAVLLRREIIFVMRDKGKDRMLVKNFKEVHKIDTRLGSLLGKKENGKGG